MSTLLLFGSIQALFLALILITGQRQGASSILLTMWMIVLAANLAGVYVASIGYYRSNPGHFGYDAALPLLHGPLLYFYVISSIRANFSFRVAQLLHLLPFVFFSIYTLIVLRDTSSYQELRTLFEQPTDPVILLFEVSIHLILLIYVTMALLSLRRYSQTLPDRYSYKEGVDLKWMQQIGVALLVITSIIVLSIVLSDFLQLFSLDFKALLFYGALAVLPFYLLFFAIRHGITNSIRVPEAAKYKNSPLSEERSGELRDELQTVMNEQELFLDGKLSVDKLAQSLEIHPKELSQVINEQFDTNFFNFVNQYRIDRFKERIAAKDHKNLSLLGIALDCGFNTKSSFNQVFKNLTGETPSAYVKSQPE